MNITDVLAHQADTAGDRTCLRSVEGCWTFAELFGKVCNLANALVASGIRSGDVVALTLARESTALVAMLAVARIGATVFSVPRNMPTPRRQHMLETVKASVLITDIHNLHYHPLNSILVTAELLEISTTDSGHRTSTTGHPWLIATGSGSTGSPKFMPVSHQQQLERMAAGKHWLPYGSEDTLLSMVHLDYYATKQRFLEAICLGAGIYLPDRKQIDFGEEIARGEVSALYGTVFHVEQILRTLPPESESHYGLLKALMVGGSTVSTKLRENIRTRLTPRLYVLYGANECHTACITGLDEVFTTPGTVGRPIPGTTLNIVDGQDRQILAGEAGLIRIKSPGMIDGYLNDRQATAQFFSGGWFYPGDIGKLTDDGQLIHLGRADNLMIMNGINIYPAEIEQVMNTHPEVADAVAWPLKHAVHQDVPVCLVARIPGSAVTVADLLTYARKHLGSSSPHRIFLASQIPRNEQGKPIMADINKLISTRPSKPLRQLQMHLSITFSPPREANLERVDLWLKEVFTIELNPPAENGNRPVGATAWLERCLMLARYLMQAAGMPIFELPHILSCDRAAGTEQNWRARVSFAAVDHYPQNAYTLALSETMNLTRSLAESELTEQSREHVFKKIQSRILKPVTKTLEQGKSTFPLLKTAHELGIPFRHLGRGVFQLGWGAKAICVDRSTTEQDSAIGARLSTNKVATAHLLRAAGLPAPNHRDVSELQQASNAAAAIGWPVVVKPADGERGEGVTVGIDSDAGLAVAFELALKSSKGKKVIIEQQVQGVCHRLFVADGKLLYAVKRLPMSVTGDGGSTIAELVEREVSRQQQLPPWKRSEIQPLDDLALATLEQAGLSPSSVLGDGALASLRPIETTLWGGVDQDVTTAIHPDNLWIALQAANLFRLQIAGIDIITPDISKPWHQNGAIINEVNYSPLLGGGDISRRNIPEYLRRLLEGDGRIPVEVYVGGQSARNLAVERQASLVKSGVSAYLTNHDLTISPAGKPATMTTKGLHQRVRALTLSRDVEFLIMVVQTDEFLKLGLPLEWVDKVNIVDLDLVMSESTGARLPQHQVERLLKLLKNWGLENP